MPLETASEDCKATIPSLEETFREAELKSVSPYSGSRNFQKLIPRAPFRRGCSQAAYATQPARQHLGLDLHLGQLDPQGQRAKHAAHRGWRVLCDGSRLTWFSRLFALYQAGAFFVTRNKRDMDAHRVYSMPTDRSTAIICDQRIALISFYASQNYLELLRHIRFKDPESGKTLVCLTNNTVLPALAFASLDKSRWQVELFFKVDPAASAHQAFHRQQRKRSQDAKMWRPHAICLMRRRD